MIFQLPSQHIFPDIELAEPDGLLAVGGDLSVERVLKAYQKGIFPWYNNGEPILWWSPDPRFIILPSTFKVSKSMRPIIRKYNYTVTVNKAFEAVIANCKLINRRDQQYESWITDEMQAAYISLHNSGYALSVELWNEAGELTGGLYGILLGAVFCGESMFAKAGNASKIAFTHFANFLFINGCKLIDCQTYTKHLENFGAKNMSRSTFLKNLEEQKKIEIFSADQLFLNFNAHFEKLKAGKTVFF